MSLESERFVADFPRPPRARAPNPRARAATPEGRASFSCLEA
jgi:hypothetical protein